MSTRRCRWSAIVCPLLLVLFLIETNTAIAQSATAGIASVEQQRVQQFREQISIATKAVNDQQYDAAVRAFLAAYAIEPQPSLLFNVAQVYRKAGKPSDALSYYERYLQQAPNSELTAKVREYVAALQASRKVDTPSASLERGTPSSEIFQGSAEERAALFRKSIESAGASYQAEDFQAAAAAYWTAYTLNPHPNILFNVAQSYRKANRLHEALTLYQRYLQQAPEAPNASLVQGYVAEVQDAIKAKQAEAERQNQARLSQAEQAVAERLEAVQEIERQIDIHRQDLAAQTKRRPLYRRGWFWGTMAAAGVGIGLAVGLGVGLSLRLPDTDFGKQMLNF